MAPPPWQAVQRLGTLSRKAQHVVDRRTRYADRSADPERGLSRPSGQQAPNAVLPRSRPDRGGVGSESTVGNQFHHWDKAFRVALIVPELRMQSGLFGVHLITFLPGHHRGGRGEDIRPQFDSDPRVRQ